MSSFQTIFVFIITKNVLDEVKVLASKLQKREQDIYEASKKVGDAIESLKTIRKTIDTVFSSWYSEALELAELIGVSESVPRKTSIQRKRSNTQSQSTTEYYKIVVAIPMLDFFINQLEQRFQGEGKQGLTLLCLVPSVMLDIIIQVLILNYLNTLTTFGIGNRICHAPCLFQAN